MDVLEVGRSAWSALLSPLAYPVSADQRLFWPFLAGALVVAVCALVVTGGLNRRALLGLFSPRVWLHRSSRLDYQLLFAKPVIRALCFAPWMFGAFEIARSVTAALDGARGIPARSAWPQWQIGLAYTVVLFLCWDASRYAVHRLAHGVPALWELHKVHHSAQVMTPFTIYRSHPLESLLFQLRGILVTGIVSGVFFHLFRSRALQVEILGVNAVGFVLNLLGGNLRHSHVWIGYPRFLERILISPAQHQLHHSAVLAQCHSNYGSFLAVWDWLGRSLQLSADHRRPRRFGLPPSELNHSPHHLGSALLRPMWASVLRLVPAPRSPANARELDAPR
jgi:sterol desaturase/sphingolipid hydroxylase (fatty acid hydroxylase superfamily)